MSNTCYDYIHAFMISNPTGTKLICQSVLQSDLLYCYNNDTNELCNYNIKKNPNHSKLWEKMNNNKEQFEIKYESDYHTISRTIVIKK